MSNIEHLFADIIMIKFTVVTMVCLLGLKMIAAMPVADHQEGHPPQPVADHHEGHIPQVIDEKTAVKSLKTAEAAVQGSVPAESVAAGQPAQAAAEQPAAVNEPAVRSSESASEAQPAEAKQDEPLQPQQPTAAVSEEAQVQPKSSEEQLEEKEEPKVLATEKKQEPETLKEAASETKESVQLAPQEQPAEISAEKKVSFLFP